MKSLLLSLVVVASLTTAAVIGYYAASSRQAPTLNAAKLVQATRAFALELRGKGSPVPTAVSLQELIRLGYLQPQDVAAFDGMKVLINPAADESHPSEALVRVQLPDGHELVALGDGSVQQR